MAAIRTFMMQGIVPATFTPMTADGEVDYDKISTYCKFLTDKGVTQVYVNGTTGEGFSLTLEEREKIVEKWLAEKKNGKLKSVVVQVGSLNLHDTVAMAKHAAAVGADGIASVPPLFFKPPTVEYLVHYCKEVAGAAPNLPFYFYHLPGATGVEPNIEDFLKQASSEIPSLVGVKFSSKDLVDMIGCVFVHAPNRDGNQYNLMYGCDEKLMAGLVMGAHGSVGSTCNFMYDVLEEIYEKTAAKDIEGARSLQYKVQQMAKVMYKYGFILGHNVAALKATMTLIDMDLGPSRSPLRPPTEKELENYRKDLQGVGFFDWYQKSK